MKELKEFDDVNVQDITPEPDHPPITEREGLKEFDFSDSEAAFEDVFKKLGIISESSSEKEKPDSENQENAENKYSEYLEKGEDGKYYDKETGKAYDSVEAWEKAQKTLAKRLEGTAEFYEEKAKKEWAKFKNAEENGESEDEKWDHYHKSQEYYEKAKECKEKAAKIREKLGDNE